MLTAIIRGVTVLPVGCDASDILLVDDDRAASELLAKLLKKRGHSCTLAGSGQEAFALAQKHSFDLMLLDLQLPDTDGLHLLEALRDEGIDSPTIVVTGHPSLPTAVKAWSYEVRDFLPKPIKSDQLVQRVEDALHEGAENTEYLWQHLEKKYRFRHVLSRNPRTRRTYLHAAKAAQSRAPVLVGGESGTGKEFLARAVHYLSDRADQAFIVLNCGAFPSELLESELFGHEKGAFTSATGTKPGLCELADGGTLFLDEIGDMSLPMQVKLLRFLQDGTFRRLGGLQEKQVNVRVVAATNQDLPVAIKERRFREDLYWRINVIPLYLPPLRERPEDLEPFSRHFLGEFAREMGRPELELPAATLEQLEAYGWPGNIRQLHNVLCRGMLLSNNGKLKPEHVILDEFGG